MARLGQTLKLSSVDCDEVSHRLLDAWASDEGLHKLCIVGLSGATLKLTNLS